MTPREYLALARLVSATDFAARFAHPFLAAKDDLTSERVGFATLVGERAAMRQLKEHLGDTMPIGAGGKGAPAPETQEFDVLPVVKSERNPYKDRISVGRTRSNDVPIMGSTVSKLHAHFRRGPSGEWLLRDSNSANGTYVKGKRLAAGEERLVESGDVVSFGGLSLWFLSASDLHAWLLARAR